MHREDILHASALRLAACFFSKFKIETLFTCVVPGHWINVSVLGLSDFKTLSYAPNMLWCSLYSPPLLHQWNSKHRLTRGAEWLVSTRSRIAHKESYNIQVMNQKLINRISLWFEVVQKVRQDNAGKLPNRKVRFFSTDETLKPTTVPVNRMTWE